MTNKKRNKGWRQNNKRRMIRRAREVLKIQGVTDAGALEKYARRWADNIKICSCGICRPLGPTYREGVETYSAGEQIHEGMLEQM
jgi:hypothetical protein